MRIFVPGLFVLFALAGAAQPAAARGREEVRIGLGFGLAFLPIYICQDLKLVEKYASAEHLDVTASYRRFLGAGPVEDAIASGALDAGPFGVAPLLAAWQRTRDTPRQVLAVSGITTMPLVLLTDRPKVHGLADLVASGRIAMPELTGPQMYFLQMQSEKLFGQFDRLGPQVVAMSHADAIQDLAAGTGPVVAYFSSPPFTQIALKEPGVHPILDSEAVIGGKASFLVLGASRRYAGAHPGIVEALDKAVDEAARLIHDDPGRAARIYLAHEPSRALDAAVIEAVLKDEGDAFGSAVNGIDAFAGFMGRHGELKDQPPNWKAVVAPALLHSPNS